MKSSLTGLISSSYDIAFCVLSLFVSFFGERGHKPRWLAFASFMIGLGALVFSLPHFFSGKYELGSVFEGKSPLCFCSRGSPQLHGNGFTDTCSVKRGLKSPPRLCVNCTAEARAEITSVICSFHGSPGLGVSESHSPHPAQSLACRNKLAGLELPGFWSLQIFFPTFVTCGDGSSVCWTCAFLI